MVLFNSEEFSQEKIDDCLIVINVKSNDILLLNSTSSFIFKQLIAQQNIHDIVDAYIAEHEDVEYSVVYKDFVSIKAQLFEEGILYEK